MFAARQKWTRGHGLHLVLVSKQIRDEVLSIIDQLNTTIIVHCALCLHDCIHHVRHELGVKYPIARHLRQPVRIGGRLCVYRDHTNLFNDGSEWSAAEMYITMKFTDYDKYPRGLINRNPALLANLTPIDDQRQVWSVEYHRMSGMLSQPSILSGSPGTKGSRKFKRYRQSGRSILTI